MKLKDIFGTDKELEKKGVVIKYDEELWVKCARPGGANKRYNKMLEALSKPFRRAIATNTLSNDKANELLMEAYAKAVVIDWGGDALTDDAGNPIPCNPENIMQQFKDFPDFFEDLKEQLSGITLFKLEQAEADLGN